MRRRGRRAMPVPGPRELTTSDGGDAVGSYREFAPPSYLADLIVCFWHRPARAQASAARVLPDGCIDLIWAGDDPPFVAGPMTAAMSPVTTAGVDITGVRFRPGVAPALLGFAASELLDLHVPLRDIWPRDEYVPWYDAAGLRSFPASMMTIASLIASRCEAVNRPDPLVADATRWIAAHPSGRLEALARQSNLSDRQMRRRFLDAVGYGPKTLQRILRLQRLLWLANQADEPRLSLGQWAFAVGHGDQPHMTREVTALTGSSPGDLLRGHRPKSAVSELFKTPPR